MTSKKCRSHEWNYTKKIRSTPMGGVYLYFIPKCPFLSFILGYYLKSVEFTQADFILWITDLSVNRPLFCVLPDIDRYLHVLITKAPDDDNDLILNATKNHAVLPVAMKGLFFFILFPCWTWLLYCLSSNVNLWVQARYLCFNWKKTWFLQNQIANIIHLKPIALSFNKI